MSGERWMVKASDHEGSVLELRVAVERLEALLGGLGAVMVQASQGAGMPAVNDPVAEGFARYRAKRKERT